MFKDSNPRTDQYVLRFFAESGWQVRDERELCLKRKVGEVVSRKHICNDCSYYNTWRRRTIKMIGDEDVEFSVKVEDLFKKKDGFLFLFFCFLYR